MPPGKLISQCPLCRTAYTQADLAVLGEQQSFRWVHCACPQCGHKMMAFMLESVGIASSIGMPTDLNAADAKRVLALAPLSSDDCIYTHAVLEQDSQDLCRLLQKSPS